MIQYKPQYTLIRGAKGQDRPKPLTLEQQEQAKSYLKKFGLIPSYEYPFDSVKRFEVRNLARNYLFFLCRNFSDAKVESLYLGCFLSDRIAVQKDHLQKLGTYMSLNFEWAEWVGYQIFLGNIKPKRKINIANHNQKRGKLQCKR